MTVFKWSSCDRIDFLENDLAVGRSDQLALCQPLVNNYDNDQFTLLYAVLRNEKLTHSPMLSLKLVGHDQVQLSLTTGNPLDFKSLFDALKAFSNENDLTLTTNEKDPPTIYHYTGSVNAIENLLTYYQENYLANHICTSKEGEVQLLSTYLTKTYQRIKNSSLSRAKPS